MQKISDKLLSFASIADPQTIEQAKLTSSLPIIHPHVALMPDAHHGLGATVGSVIPTVDAIIPAAVGVDIGCGMIAVRTQWYEQELRERLGGDLSGLRQAIEAAIPLSVGGVNAELTPSAEQRTAVLEARAHFGLIDDHTFYPANYAGNWKRQLGTLGSGNHFIEVSVDEQGRVWLFLHSGSRGIGNRIAQHHIGVAKALAKRWHVTLPHDDLAYLPSGTDEFDAYMAELKWAQEFALANREEMMDRVITAFELETTAPVVTDYRINCHHNYTELAHHGGRQVYLTRKGAIDASTGTWGLIPGSMGDASHVVRGKGNAASLDSAPHGAGRVLSRRKAKETFTQDQLRERMAGIEYRDTAAFIDEHPEAYKPIDVVMEDAADLVDIVFTLRQIVNVKGD